LVITQRVVVIPYLTNNRPEERKSHLLRGGSLESRNSSRTALSLVTTLTELSRLIS
jgi:hypothetical protein